MGGLDAGLSLTQSDDPRSGGHFTLGTSKTPPGPARVGSRVVVDVLVVLKVADCQDAGLGVVEAVGPIPNGVTTVGGAKTRLVIYKIRHS